MIKGFKEFLSRGNVADLAVGISIGVAFTALVAAIGEAIIKPVVSVASGSDSDLGLGFRILPDNPATFVDLGALINAAVVFVVTMFVIYALIVTPINAMRARRKAGTETEEPSEEIQLLREIRDALNNN